MAEEHEGSGRRGDARWDDGDGARVRRASETERGRSAWIWEAREGSGGEVPEASREVEALSSRGDAGEVIGRVSPL